MGLAVGFAATGVSLAFWAGDGFLAALVLATLFGATSGLHTALSYAGVTATDVAPSGWLARSQALRVLLAMGGGFLAAFVGLWNWIVTSASVTGCFVHCDPDDRSIPVALLAAAMTVVTGGAFGCCLAEVFSARASRARTSTWAGLVVGGVVALGTLLTARWW